MPGLRVDRLLRMHSVLSNQLAMYILKKVFHILKYIHSQGFIYRDVKASNILIDP